MEAPKLNIKLTEDMRLDNCIGPGIEEFICSELCKAYDEWKERFFAEAEQELLYGTGKNEPKGFLNLSS